MTHTPCLLPIMGFFFLVNHSIYKRKLAIFFVLSFRWKYMISIFVGKSFSSRDGFLPFVFLTLVHQKVLIKKNSQMRNFRLPANFDFNFLYTVFSTFLPMCFSLPSMKIFRIMWLEEMLNFQKGGRNPKQGYFKN